MPPSFPYRFAHAPHRSGPPRRSHTTWLTSEYGGARLGLLALALLAGCGFGAWWLMRDGTAAERSTLSFTPPIAPRAVTLNVIESGSLEALKFHRVTSEVESRVEVTYIAPEGKIITDEDVRNKVVLVRLDGSTIEEKLLAQESNVITAQANYDNAIASRDIQVQQNASDIRKARLDVRFARLDVERYVGTAAWEDLSAIQEMSKTTDGDTSTKGNVSTASENLLSAIEGLLSRKELDGEALQKTRELDSAISLAQEEHSRADDKLKYSERLEKKGFISRDELQADRLALQRRAIELESAKTARNQFVRYDFPKEVEQLLSDVSAAEDALARAIAKAKSARRRVEADVQNDLTQVKQQTRRRDRFKQQLEHCEIRATKPGLVVYASSGRGRWGRDEDEIREGATVRHRQTLIRIPDPKRMGVETTVHETVVDRVKVGQRAFVVVDADPNTRLNARVIKVARMPKPPNRWINPDLKVYETTLELEGTHPELKPGMSVQVEIVTRTLDEVLAIPIQCLAGPVETPHVYVRRTDADGHEATKKQPVTPGPTTEHLVVIESGLQSGQQVLLNPPEEKAEEKNVNSDRRDARPRGDGKRANEKGPGANTSGSSRHMPRKKSTPGETSGKGKPARTRE